MTVSKIPTNNILTLDIDAFMLKAKAVIHEVFQNKSILTVPDHRQEASNDQDYITKPLTPLYAWAGGKRRLIAAYKPYLPDLSKLKHYVEPFFGAGAMFCEVFNNHRDSVKSYHLNDINKEIVNLLKTIKADCSGFIDELKAIEQLNYYKTVEGQKHFYYSLREQYRSLPTGEQWTLKGTAMFYFLLTRMFRGLYQQKHGKIYTSFQQNKKGFDYENIKNWSVALQNAVITCGSYEKVRVNKKSFLFCDPPYRDCSVMYSTSFNDHNQEECFKWIQGKVKDKQVYSLLCNKDIGDGFFSKIDDKTTNSEQVVIPYQHLKGKKRTNPVKELLMVFKSETPTFTLKAA